MLEIKDLSFSYGKKEKDALHSVSLKLDEGCLGICLGPNGSGKSTLLKCIAGVQKYKEGSILYDGKDVSTMKMKERAKCFSYVPQSFFVSSLSVYDTVLTGRIPYIGFRLGKEDKEITEKVISEMGLSSLALRNVSDLSGGEKQKVMLARAIAQEASLLLLDEPTSALDITASLASMSLLRELVKEKKLSCLVSMHDLPLALKAGDQYYLFKEGNVVKQGEKNIITSTLIKDVYGLDCQVRDEDGETFIIYGGIKK